MKTCRKLLVLLLSLALCVGLLAMPAAAAELTKDGLQITITPDKTSYSEGEKITFTISVVNNNPYEVTDVELAPVVPEGYQIAVGSPTKIDKLGAGATETLTVVHEPIPEATTPSTGATTPSTEQTQPSTPSGGDSGDTPAPTGEGGEVVLFALMMIIAACVVILMAMLNKRGSRRVMAAVLALVMAASLISGVPFSAIAVDQGAEEEDGLIDKAITVEVEVVVDGAPVMIPVKISYSRPITRSDLQAAVVETAWAYYMKGSQVQYESNAFTAITNKDYGAYRVTEGMAPEYATSDTTHFSVCTYFCYDTYYTVFDGYRMGMGNAAADARTWKMWENYPVDDESVVLRWASSDLVATENETLVNIDASVTTGAELAAWLAENGRYRDMLEPGDVVVVGGHATMYIGNDMMLECAGAKYSADTGTDALENQGAIKLNSFYQYYLNHGLDSASQVLIIRPLDHMLGDNDLWDMNCGYSFNEGTETREEYPGIEIDRTVDATPYGSVASKGILTYSIKILNNSGNTYANVGAVTTEGVTVNYPNWRSEFYGLEDYAGQDYLDIPVVEVIPEGATVIPTSISGGGTIANGKITWSVDIPVGESATLTYSVYVDAERGAVITSDGGSVGNIPSNSISNRVSGKKLEGNSLANLDNFYDYAEQYTAVVSADDFVNDIYEQVFGLKLNLPSVQTLMDALFETKTVQAEDDATADMLVLKDYSASNLYRTMLVDKYIGGYKVHTVHLDNARIWDLNVDYFEVGDILVKVKSLNSYNADVMVYMGNGVFAVIDEDGYCAGLNSPALWRDIFKSSYQCFFLLRPSQAYDNLNTELTAVLPFVPDTSIEGSNTEDTPEEPGTLADWQAAIVETANAYLRKAQFAKYSNDALTALGKEGPLAVTWNIAPEAITESNPYYGIGEYLIYEIFQNAVGMKLAEDQGAMMDIQALTAAYAVDGTPQVADIMVLTDDTLALFLGDGKYLVMTEADGIAVKTNVETKAILRPLTADCGAHLTAAGAGRIAFKGLEINISSPDLKSNYNTAAQNGKVTYVITVKNNGTDAYENLEIIQYVSRKALFANDADSHVDNGAAFTYTEANGKLSWVVPTLAAGQEIQVSFTVTVKECINEQSQYYVYYLTTNGKVGGNETYVSLNVLNNRIGMNKLTEEQAKQSVTFNAENLEAAKKATGKDAMHVSYVRNYYTSFMGISGFNSSTVIPGITSTMGLKNKTDSTIGLVVDPEVHYYNYGILLPVDSPSTNVQGRKLLVDGFFGGELIYSETGDNTRILNPSMEYMEPGDYIMAFYGKECGNDLKSMFWIYLGYDETAGVYKIVGHNAEGVPSVLTYTTPTAFFEENGFVRPYDADASWESSIAAFAVSRPSQVGNLWVEEAPEEVELLEVKADSDIGNFKTVEKNGTINYTITIKNNDTKAYTNLTLALNVAGGTIQSVGQGGVIGENTVTFTIETLPVGETVTLTYAVKASDTMSEKATGYGTLSGDGVEKTVKLVNTVGSAFTAAQLESFQSITSSVSGAGQVRDAYAAVLGSTDAGSYIGGKSSFVGGTLSFKTSTAEGYQIVRNTAVNDKFTKTIVLYGGSVENIGDAYHISANEFDPEFMDPGDYLIIQTSATTLYLYLGKTETDGDVQYHFAGGISYSAAQIKAMLSESVKYYFLLRVAQAIDVSSYDSTTTEPEQPGTGTDTPEQPGGETPEQPGGETPEQPGGETPEQPGGETPEQPGGETPEQPGGETPEQPGGETPEQPGGETPEQPGGETPEQPGGETPEQPGGETPEQPGGETPEQPGGETPEQPGGETPEQPGGETPEQPGGETPEQPGGETPEQPGGETPEQPANTGLSESQKAALMGMTASQKAANKTGNHVQAIRNLYIELCGDGYDWGGLIPGKSTVTAEAHGGLTKPNGYYTRKINESKDVSKMIAWWSSSLEGSSGEGFVNFADISFADLEPGDILMIDSNFLIYHGSYVENDVTYYRFSGNELAVTNCTAEQVSTIVTADTELVVVMRPSLVKGAEMYRVLEGLSDSQKAALMGMTAYQMASNKAGNHVQAIRNLYIELCGDGYDWGGLIPGKSTVTAEAHGGLIKPNGYYTRTINESKDVSKMIAWWSSSLEGSSGEGFVNFADISFADLEPGDILMIDSNFLIYHGSYVENDVTYYRFSGNELAVTNCTAEQVSTIVTADTELVVVMRPSLVKGAEMYRVLAS